MEAPPCRLAEGTMTMAIEVLAGGRDLRSLKLEGEEA
jgi:hypothetical protein